MDAALDDPEKRPEIIRLYVVPQINTNDFHEVTPTQLEEYLSECREQKRNHMHRKNLYHQLSLMAKIDTSTSSSELERLFQSDVRTLLVQMRFNRPQELEQIFLKINTSIDKFYMEAAYKTPIGIAMEINGELLTTGRMRNDSRPFVDEGNIVVLTTNEDYKYCSFKEIVYVTNLWRYLEAFKLDDKVCFEYNQIVGKVIKCGAMRPLTLEIIRGGYLTSYMNVTTTCYVETKELGEKDIVDVDTALRCGAHFLVVSGLKSASYLAALKNHVKSSAKIIGSINLEYLDTKFVDIADHLMLLDAVWMDYLFCPSQQRRLTSAINQCNAFEKCLIGTVPLKTCSDFKKLENHERIKQMDSLLIEKSPVRKKFPIIAKKLLPVSNRQIHFPPLDTLSCGDGIVNFVLRTIYSITCQGIVICNSCPKAAIAFATHQVYCPVIVVVKDEDLARVFNLRRNLKTVMYSGVQQPTEFGIDFGRKQGLFNTGDFVISISDSIDENAQICVNLRAYYLPPNV